MPPLPLLCALLWPALGPALPVGAALKPTRRVPIVAVLVRPGMRTYETVVEEFKTRVRADVRKVSVIPGDRKRTMAALSKWRPDLTFAIGQSAYDFARWARLSPLIHGLVYHRLDPAHHGIRARVDARLVLGALKAAHPQLRNVAYVHGPRSASLAALAKRAARRARLRIVPIVAQSPAGAISALRRASAKIDAIWLAPDLEVLSPQVFKYALTLQFGRRIPLVGASRRHVSQGAMLAYHVGPTRLGRRAADLANRLLSAGGKLRRVAPTSGPDKTYRAAAPYDPGKPLLTVNRAAAARIGADLAALRKLGAAVIN